MYVTTSLSPSPPYFLRVHCNRCTLPSLCLLCVHCNTCTTFRPSIRLISSATINKYRFSSQLYCHHNLDCRPCSLPFQHFYHWHCLLIDYFFFFVRHHNHYTLKLSPANCFLFVPSTVSPYDH